MRRDMIGEEFTTPKGAKLRIIGCSKKDKKNNNIYTLTCSLCSKDKELFGDGLFYSRISHLNSGKIPCGCSTRRRWTLEQYEILVKRSMVGTHYKFTKFVENGNINSEKSFYYICGKHSGKVAKVSDWLSHNCRCQECGFDAHRVRTEDFIEKSNNVHGNKYDYSSTTYFRARDKVKIVCKEHGEFLQTPDNHLSSVGCPSCARHGFDPHKESSVYVILAESDRDTFTGYGISGNVEHRLKVHRRELSKKGYHIANIEVFNGVHGEVATDTEKEVKLTFEVINTGVGGFIREATHGCLYHDVVNFIRERTQ